MPFNPERMRPTEASNALIVKEANEVIFQTAKTVIREEKSKSILTRSGQLIIAANRFLKGVKQFP